MQTARPLLILSLTLACAGCESAIDPNSPSAALSELSSNFKNGNLTAVYGQLSAKTIGDLTKTLESIIEQGQLIAAKYPADQKSAFTALYPEAVRSAKSPSELFVAFVRERASKKRFLDGIMYGLETYGKPTVVDGRTRVLTRAGENYEFVLENEKWRTTLFEKPVHRNLERVLLNRQRLGENLALIKAASAPKPQAPEDGLEPKAGAGSAAPGQSP